MFQQYVDQLQLEERESRQERGSQTTKNSFHRKQYTNSKIVTKNIDYKALKEEIKRDMERQLREERK